MIIVSVVGLSRSYTSALDMEDQIYLTHIWRTEYVYYKSTWKWSGLSPILVGWFCYLGSIGSVSSGPTCLVGWFDLVFLF